MRRPLKATPAEIGDGADRQVSPHDAQVPAAIRQRVLALLQPGDTLWRCPRLSAPRGPLGIIGVGRRDVVIEWWLIGADGDLIEAFWQQE